MVNGKLGIPEVQEQIGKFLEINQLSSIKELDGKIVIENPWDDESVYIDLSNFNEDFSTVLNKLLLPPNFSAFFHTNTSILEFIYTVTDESDILWKRDFAFRFKGNNIHCWFGESSTELLLIAKNVIINSGSQTNYRNLRILRDFCNQDVLPKSIIDFFSNKKPISFYVGPLSIGNSDQLIELARHLNFYMKYFDEESPEIVIHQNFPELPERSEPAIEQDFPKTIIGREIDVYLLDLWTSAHALSGRLAFLYYYQMLEFAAFYYVDDQVKNNIARVIRKPDILDCTDDCIAQIIEEMQKYRTSDESKLKNVVTRTVNPSDLWNIIIQFKEYFATPQEFEGGFSLDAPIKKEWLLSDFEQSWKTNIPDKLKDIRNALVHSRDSQNSLVISPGKANNTKLIPWIQIIQKIACQVTILYKP